MHKLKNVFSAQLVRYNANNRGTHTGDCVNRALSLAFDIDYVEMNKELNSVMKSQHQYSWKIPAVYRTIILNHGGSAPQNVSGLVDNQLITLEDFADNYISTGTYLVETGGKPDGRSDHIVCVIDGKVYDSWDSRRQYPKKYYTVPITHKKFTEVSMSAYVIDLQVSVRNEAEKLCKKYGWSDAQFSIVAIDPERFSMKIACQLRFPPCDYSDTARNYSFEFACVSTPSSTAKEVQAIIQKTVKVRMYDRFYAINQQEQKKKEAYEIKQQSSETTPSHLTWMDSRESRFYNSLPGWAQAIITRLEIYEPGQFSYSYTVKINRLPSDHSHPDVKFPVRLEAYDAAQMRDMLKRYHDNSELPYEDYDPYEEY